MINKIGVDVGGSQFRLMKDTVRVEPITYEFVESGYFNPKLLMPTVMKSPVHNSIDQLSIDGAVARLRDKLEALISHLPRDVADSEKIILTSPYEVRKEVFSKFIYDILPRAQVITESQALAQALWWKLEAKIQKFPCLCLFIDYGALVFKFSLIEFSREDKYWTATLRGYVTDELIGTEFLDLDRLETEGNFSFLESLRFMTVRQHYEKGQNFERWIKWKKRFAADREKNPSFTNLRAAAHFRNVPRFMLRSLGVEEKSVDIVAVLGGGSSLPWVHRCLIEFFVNKIEEFRNDPYVRPVPNLAWSDSFTRIAMESFFSVGAILQCCLALSLSTQPS
eukprot:Gregarina_sp_Poly_1__1389@NODE_1345_length_4331_cov_47_703565_g903_i0_p3_GENE_NODE_1345_length_4331_cov_47_703565_g903_i0NODE_1345_length_4331_cov_47_703565_g903_i0_p3_ORF_typecomplete_len337_score41_55HSP70/PF00012_20/0_00053_NODE_1345_length_4331_cov_47_703565_g903_i01391149